MPDNIATLVYRVLFPLSRSFHRKGNKTAFFLAAFNEKNGKTWREQNGNLMSKYLRRARGEREERQFTITLVYKRIYTEDFYSVKLQSTFSRHVRKFRKTSVHGPFLYKVFISEITDRLTLNREREKGRR